MPDPASAPAKRRLNTILSDENYGPKLARMNRRDERRVLDLIEANRGREARQAIDQLDAHRRKRRTVIARARRYASRGASERVQERPEELDWMDGEADIETAFWREYDRQTA